MVKPEWGTKRTCPKCGTRFYDLTKDEPVACIECAETWYPEPVLKSKQPIPFEEAKKKEAEPDSDLADDELEDVVDDDDEVSPDNEVDLGGDDDLGVTTRGDDDDNDNWFSRLPCGWRSHKGPFPQAGRASQGASVRVARGLSSAGRALQWHCRGQRFDPARLHHSTVFWPMPGCKWRIRALPVLTA